MVFVVDMVAMFFFYSLVRRWRAKTLWKNSYLCRIFRLLKKGALQMYDNSDIVLRTCVPYGLFLDDGSQRRLDVVGHIGDKVGFHTLILHADLHGFRLGNSPRSLR